MKFYFYRIYFKIHISGAIIELFKMNEIQIKVELTNKASLLVKKKIRTAFSVNFTYTTLYSYHVLH